MAYWLFQSNPDFFDLLAALETMDPGDGGDWDVTAHPNEMAPGDGVAFWVAGKEGGLAAFGTLVSKVYKDKNAKKGYSVDWELTHIVDPPIPRPQLKAHSLLSKMRPIAPTYVGTNFAVTPEQWNALLEIANADLDKATVAPHSLGQAEGVYSVQLMQLSEATFTPAEELQQLETLIHDKKQVILEGPPGSGKTYVARLFARYLAGLPLDRDHDEHVEIVQFHQSYGYEDFVAGIRPATSETGTLTYETRPGVFVEMCNRAAAHPDETFVLIIDEINRGNLSRIFGELLYGLEYRNQPVRMQYPVQIGNETTQHLTIPDNLYLIGTMNSTDRSLALIDYALRRRFYFWQLMPVIDGRAPVLETWLDANAMFDPAEREWLLASFIALNREISTVLGDDYQIGHSYFMLDTEQFDDGYGLDRVWFYAIEPLLREYFHTRRDIDTRIANLRSLFFDDDNEPQL